MKSHLNNIFILIAIFLVAGGVASAATTISADISTGGSLFVTGTSTFFGNVGIGTTNPASKLEVVDYSASAPRGITSTNYVNGGSVGTIFLRHARGTVSSPLPLLLNDGLGGVAFAGYTGGSEGTGDGFSGHMALILSNASENYDAVSHMGADITFWTNPNNVGISPLEVMRLTHDSKVGIGTSTPSLKLTVAGPSAAPDGSPTTGIFRLNSTDTSSVMFGVVNSSYAWIQGILPGIVTLPLVLNPNGGNVGIGTTTPTVPLQVTTPALNATTSIEIGKAGQNKGSCLVLYDTSGNPVYATVAPGATTFNLSTTSCE